MEAANPAATLSKLGNPAQSNPSSPISPRTRIPLLTESKLEDYKMDNNQLRHRMQRLDLESKIRSVNGYQTQQSELSQYDYKYPNPKETPNSSNLEFQQEITGPEGIKSGQLDLLHGLVVFDDHQNQQLCQASAIIKTQRKGGTRKKQPKRRVVED